MKIDLGQTLTILANLAVVAGIIFLIVQIREDRAYAIVENTVIVGQGLAGWYEEVAHDETLADILMRGSNDFEALTPFEQHQFDLLMRSLIIEVEMGRIARSFGVSPTGSGPKGESLFLTGIYRRLLDLPGTQAWWAAADRRGIPHGAIIYIDDYLGLEYSGANR
jgi:hypothetical protein